MPKNKFKIKSNEIRKQIIKIWPKCYVLNTDQVFLLPEEKEVKALIQRTQTNLIRFVDNIAECDDISIILWGRIKEIRARLASDNQIPVKNQYSWPLGICFGQSFKGWPAPHWQNICICKDAVFLIESQTMEFWQPIYPDDDILFALI